MFKYSPEIDNWSHKMIQGIDGVWGFKIEKNLPKKDLVTSDRLITYLNSYFEEYGKIIFDRFNELTGLSFNSEEIGKYINTTSVSLHNGQQKYISIGLNHSFFSYPTVVIHEIFHIYFAYYIYSERFLRANGVKKTADAITPQEENVIKEIITVIINDVFSDIIDVNDSGYPDHLQMREKLLEFWKKEKNFDKFVTEAIKLFRERV